MYTWTRPEFRQGLPDQGWRTKTQGQFQMADGTNVLDGDPLAASTGVVNGLLCGAMLWAVILWAIF